MSLPSSKEEETIQQDEHLAAMGEENVEESHMARLLSVDQYAVPDDNSDKHLAWVVAGTLWWYLYTSVQVLYFHPPQEFFGLSAEGIQWMGYFITASQLMIYAGCYKLARASTLQEAQTLVNLMTAVCIPADVMTTLVNPTGSKGITILVFAEITMFFGIYLAHYLRKASFRELPPEQHHSSSSTPLEISDNFGGILQTIREYRPPAHQQATHLAVSFTRSFVAFTIVTGSVGEYILAQQHNQGADPQLHSLLVLGSLLVVAFHTALECALTTLYPGIGLERFTSFLVLETILYSVHMFAASLATVQSVFGTSLIDQALYIWLFGSATAKVIDRSSRLLGKIDFDEKLGLSDLDGGTSR